MADNTIGWGQGSVNNTNDWGKGKANSTNDWGSIYANSPSGDTNIEGGSAGTDFTTNLVASYNFDSDFTDYTGNNDAIGHNSPLISINDYVVNKGLNNTQGSPYLTIPDSNDFSFTDGVNDLPFSISFWINFNTTNLQAIIWKGGGSSDREYRIQTADGFGNGFQIKVMSPTTDFISAVGFDSSPYSINTFYHLAFTYDGSGSETGLKIYVNGVDETTTTSQTGTYTGMVNSNFDTAIGVRGDTLSGLNSSSKIDELHVWKDRELSSAEVLEIYNTEDGGTSILPALPSPTGLLADYPNASGAYSLRNLISTTTNVVRVRRSSDNAEQDFSATEITDGTLTTFTGANDGFVTTWYDQSGNNNNVLNTSATEQPKIVNIGNLILENGKPSIDFSIQINIKLSIQSITPFTGFSQLCVATPKTLNSNGFCVFVGLDWGSGEGLGVRPTLKLYDLNGGANNRNALDNTISLNEQVLLYSQNISNSSILYKNGTSISNATGTTTSENDIIIGNSGFLPSSSSGALIQEVILYDSNQSTNRSGIETNINNHYSIY